MNEIEDHYTMLKRELAKERAALFLAEQEVERLNKLFNLQQTRMNKATKLWQIANHSQNLPDLGVLLDWLLSERAQLLDSHLYQATRAVEAERLKEEG